MKLWDVAIVGAGPGGIQCGIAAASEALTAVVIERAEVGGQIGQTPLLENSLFARGGITGPELAREMREQAERMGVSIEKGEVTALERDHGAGHLVLTAGKRAIAARHVVLAMGQNWRHLEVPGLKAGIRLGGVHYGPVESIRVPGKGAVAVCGGGPSAGQAILALADQGHKVHVILRSNLNMPYYLVERIRAAKAEGRVVLHFNAALKRVAFYAGRMGLLIAGATDDTLQTIQPIHRLFMCSGLEPATAWVPEEIERDEYGRILVGKDANQDATLETTMDGVFAIGDCRSGSTARVGVAIGDGSMVVTELWNKFLASRACTNCDEVLRS